MLSLLKCAFISCLLAVLASSEPCDIKSFGSHHCHLDMSNLTSAKVTTPAECATAVCAAGAGLDNSQWCAAGAGCSPVGCYGATVSKQAQCPDTHGWVASLVNYSPPPAPPPGMKSRTVPQPTADKHGAKCLNGNAPTLEYRLNTSSTKWILFLEGGGWCYGATGTDTIKSCAGKAGFVPNDGKSSHPLTHDRHSTPDYGGVMGSSPDTNPDFHSWNAIFIHYCDGASMGSSRTEPIAVKDHNGKPASLWMRGRNNFNAVIDDLLSTQGMSKATEVILSGGSAGGLAVFYNLDHLVTLLPPSVRVTGFPDAGFFMDAPNYVADFKGADPVWNVTGSGGTNANCLAAYPSAEQWKCLLAPYLLEHITADIYVMNSAYDAWQIGNNKVGCVSTPSKPCDDSAVQAYGTALKARVKAGLAAKKTAGGAFIDSCYVHEQNVNYCANQGMPNCVGWSPLEGGSKKWGYTTAVTSPTGESLTPQQAFSKYYFSKSGGPPGPTLIDPLALQKNEHCVYLGHPAY